MYCERSVGKYIEFDKSLEINPDLIRKVPRKCLVKISKTG